MEIIAALFIDDIETRQVPGPSTRIDLSGVQFSAPAPAPVPCTIAPHLVVLVWAPPSDDPSAFGALEVVFRRIDAEPDAPPMARNVQPLQIEPGKFNYRLVRGELTLDEYGTVLATCRIDQGPERVVPYTVLPPVS
jgi:hypothetical protein